MSEKREMTAMEFLKEYKRMCDYHEPNCLNCGIAQTAEFYPNCGPWIADNPEQAISIVQNWAKEHPVKTMLQDFLEKYPNAPMNKKGFPDGVCPRDLGYVDEECKSPTPFNTYCFECWNRPLEVKE